MLKKAAVNKLKQTAIKKAGQAISGATKGLVPGELGEKVAGAAAKKALPGVFKNGGKMKPKKKVVAQGADREDVRGDRRARRAQNRYNRKARRYNKKNPEGLQMTEKKTQKYAGGGITPSGGSGMGAVFAEDQLIGSLDMGPMPAPPKKNSAKQVEEKSEEAAKQPKEKKDRDLKGKAKKAIGVARGFRDRYEARAAKNKHHTAAMTAMSSYAKGGKMNPTDPKKKIKSMLEGGASDKEINAYLKKEGIDKTHDVTWDNVEMKVNMKPKKGDFGEPDKPGQRSDNFKGGGKLKAAIQAVRGAKKKEKKQDVQGQYTQAMKNGKVEYENRKGEKETLSVSRRAAKTADKQGYLKDANYKRRGNTIVRSRRGRKA